MLVVALNNFSILSARLRGNFIAPALHKRLSIRRHQRVKGDRDVPVYESVDRLARVVARGLHDRYQHLVDGAAPKLGARLLGSQISDLCGPRVAIRASRLQCIVDRRLRATMSCVCLAQFIPLR